MNDTNNLYLWACFRPNDLTPFKDFYEPILAEMPDHWSPKPLDEFHESIAFLGKQPREIYPEICDIFSRAAKEIKQTPRIYPGLGHFLNLSYPEIGKKKSRKPKMNVIYAAPDNPGRVQASQMHRRLAGLLAHQAFPYGIRSDKFNPHATLAKVPNEDDEQTQEFVLRFINHPSPEWLCDSLYLMNTRQNNHPDHPDNNPASTSRYEILEKFDLAP